MRMILFDFLLVRFLFFNVHTISYKFIERFLRSFEKKTLFREKKCSIETSLAAHVIT